MTGQVSKASPAQVQQALLKSRFVLEPLITGVGLNISARPKYFPLIGAYMAQHYQGEGVAQSRFGLNHYAWGGEHINVAQFNIPDNLLGAAFKLQTLDHHRYALYDAAGQLVLRGHVGELAKSTAFQVPPF